MKNKLIKILIIVLIVIIVILSIFTVKNNDEKRFKQEYEKYNDIKNTNANKKYISLEIPLQNGVKYITSKEAIKILKKQTGIIYFGYPQCPWCRSIIEVLLETLKEENINTLYYYNALAIRDEKILKNNEVITAKEGTDDYYEILDLLGEKADTYEGLNDSKIKRLYFPTVVFVNNGKIEEIHTSSVASQTDPYKKLDKKQQKELKKIYKSAIQKMNNGNVCSGPTAC